MEQNLEKFTSTLDDIKKIFIYYDSLEPIFASLSTKKKKKRYKDFILLREKYLQIKNIQRILLQKGIIISVYGVWENFIRKLVIQFTQISFLAEKNFSSSPDKFRITYLDKYLDFLSKQRSDWKLSSKLNDHIRNLHTSINEGTCAIDEDIFFKNYANYRINTISEICSSVGIKDLEHKIIKNERFIDFLEKTQEFRIIRDDSIKLRLAFKILEDFIEDRNIISHGKSEFQLKDNSTLTATIEYLGLLGSVIFEIFSKELSMLKSLIKVELNEKICSNIGTFTLPERVIKGEKIKIKKGNNLFDELTILEIHNKDDIAVEEGKKGEEVSIKFNKRFKDCWEFYIEKR